MRDRLVELIRTASHELTTRCVGDCGDCADKIADHLLENGVIVPPCKVGDVVYTFFCKEVDEGVVVCCEYSRASGFSYMSSNGRFPTLFNENKIGKTVFLTREEAEAKLKGGEG